MSKLTPNERLNLKKMIDENDVSNNTDNIRTMKHSPKIRADVGEIIKVKLQNLQSSPEDLENLCRDVAPFLYDNYTEIFHKIIKNEINLTIFKQFLGVLSQIEEGELDQHEGSVRVGTILKELYIDSAMKVADKKDKEYEASKPPPPKPASIPISWEEYKKLKHI